MINIPIYKKVSLHKLIYDIYPTILLNYTKYNDYEIDKFNDYIFNKIITKINIDKNYKIALILTQLINYDKYINAEHELFNNFINKVTECCSNKYTYEVYIKLCDEVNIGIRKFLMNKQHKLIDYLPKQVITYETSYSEIILNIITLFLFINMIYLFYQYKFFDIKFMNNLI